MNEKLKAAYEPTNLDLFDLPNLIQMVSDLSEQASKQKNADDWLQLKGYEKKIILEIEMRTI